MRYVEEQPSRMLVKAIYLLLGIVSLLLLATGWLTLLHLFPGTPENMPVAVKTDTAAVDTAEPSPSSTVVAAETTMIDTIDQIVDGKDVATGLIADEGMQVVKATCTACHSSKLILQAGATREGWLEKIRWMQQTQNLWDLGENEPIILDYLAKNYAPAPFNGRRQPLEDIEWYRLED